MENRKMNLDRPKISSEEIQKRQDFNQLVNKIKTPKKPFYKTYGFWGVVGIATVAIPLLITTLSNNNTNLIANDNNITLANQPPSNDLPKDTKCIVPLSEENALKYETHKIDVRVDNTLTLKDGSTVFFPKGSVLASDVNEPVTIKTRVFHNQAEVLSAGIPMDHNGGAFESAGMIEVKGYQNNKEVKINSKNPMEISLALHKNPETFNFYVLDEEKREWEDTPCEYSANNNVETIDNSTASVEELEGKIEILDNRIETNEKELKLLKNPTHEEYKIPKDLKKTFDLDFDKNEFPELAKLKGVNFEMLPNQNNYSSIVSTTWSKMDLKQTGNDSYVITFSKSGAKEIAKVRPVLTGSEKNKAKKEFDEAVANIDVVRAELNKKIKQDILDKQLTERDLRKAVKVFQSNVTTELNAVNGRPTQARMAQKANSNIAIAGQASFRTTRFGVFNCDKPIKYPAAAGIIPIALFQQWKQKIKSIRVFNKKKDVSYVYGSNSPTRDIASFGLHSGENIIFVTSSMDKVGYLKIDGKDFVRELNVQELSLEELKIENVQKLLYGESENSSNETASL